MQDNVRQRFAGVAHLLPDDKPLASSAGGFESYAEGEEYRHYAQWLLSDGDYVLTDRTLIFIEPPRIVKFPLDRIESFEPRQRVEDGRIRHVMLTMRSGQIHQLAAAATFVDDVLAALGQPNASDGLLQLKGGEQALAKLPLDAARMPENLPASEQYPTGPYDALLTPTRLLGWGSPERIFELALADICEWRQARALQFNVQLTFKDGTVQTFTIAPAFADAIRKTAGVRKRRLRR
ncbi:hypothetical protein ACIBI4_04305 [Streptomyces sp. NPDC050418]|uniref:hypothetical protein n=1 Tax=Streptomyces sp. NPDC050418 TaxID=3365612 RepID=UPI0037AF2916